MKFQVKFWDDKMVIKDFTVHVLWKLRWLAGPHRPASVRAMAVPFSQLRTQLN